MIRFYILTHRVSFNDDEKAFLESVAPNMSEVQARRLLDLSVCNSAVAGVLLTEEKREADNLYFLLAGTASVEVEGTVVAKLGPKSLVGEMSLLTGMSASATVRLTEHSRIISINLIKLNEFLDKNQEIRHELQSHFAVQVTQKLILANSALSSQ
jgi:CRP-like cAMP-binding protein